MNILTTSAMNGVGEPYHDVIDDATADSCQDSVRKRNSSSHGRSARKTSKKQSTFFSSEKDASDCGATSRLPPLTDGHVRAPGDLPPHPTQLDATDTKHSSEVCIACKYTQQREAACDNLDSDVDAKEKRTAYEEMMQLIDTYYNNGTSNRQLVDMVHKFYNTEIRCNWDYGEWSRKNIWDHIMHHSNNERVQCNEIRSNLMFQIEGLRNHAWKRKVVFEDDAEMDRRDFDGIDNPGRYFADSPDSRSKPLDIYANASGMAKVQFEPDHKTLRLMGELMKLHNSLQESAHRRAMHPNSATR